MSSPQVSELLALTIQRTFVTHLSLLIVGDYS
jgi:hypothetical protein